MKKRSQTNLMIQKERHRQVRKLRLRRSLNRQLRKHSKKKKEYSTRSSSKKKKENSTRGTSKKRESKKPEKSARKTTKYPNSLNQYQEETTQEKKVTTRSRPTTCERGPQGERYAVAKCVAPGRTPTATRHRTHRKIRFQRIHARRHSNEVKRLSGLGRRRRQVPDRAGQAQVDRKDLLRQDQVSSRNPATKTKARYRRCTPRTSGTMPMIYSCEQDGLNSFGEEQRGIANGCFVIARTCMQQHKCNTQHTAA